MRFATSLRKRFIGREMSFMIQARRSRPRFQVLISVKMKAANTSGNQPPCGTLVRLALKKVTSTIRKSPASPIAFQAGQPKRSRAMTLKSIVVKVIVPQTATPYVPARLVEFLKARISPMHPTARPQLTSGM